jgi:hypothetical protein
MTASCQAQAYQQFPPQLQQIQASNGYYTPVTTNCYSTGYVKEVAGPYEFALIDTPPTLGIVTVGAVFLARPSPAPREERQWHAPVVGEPALPVWPGVS